MKVSPNDQVDRGLKETELEQLRRELKIDHFDDLNTLLAFAPDQLSMLLQENPTLQNAIFNQISPKNQYFKNLSQFLSTNSSECISIILGSLEEHFLSVFTDSNELLYTLCDFLGVKKFGVFLFATPSVFRIIKSLELNQKRHIFSNLIEYIEYEINQYEINPELKPRITQYLQLFYRDVKSVSQLRKIFEICPSLKDEFIRDIDESFFYSTADYEVDLTEWLPFLDSEAPSEKISDVVNYLIKWHAYTFSISFLNEQQELLHKWMPPYVQTHINTIDDVLEILDQSTRDEFKSNLFFFIETKLPDIFDSLSIVDAQDHRQAKFERIERLFRLLLCYSNSTTCDYVKKLLLELDDADFHSILDQILFSDPYLRIIVVLVQNEDNIEYLAKVSPHLSVEDRWKCYENFKQKNHEEADVLLQRMHQEIQKRNPIEADFLLILADT